MTVIRWNPLREIDDLFVRAGQFAQVAHNRTERGDSFTPLADVSETPSGYLIELELPGVAADQVEVKVHEGVLTIAGERKTPLLAGDEESDTDTSRQVHRAERRHGTFERRFRLPKDARAEAIEASAREGVLSVSIGRHEEAAPRAIEVQVA